MLTVVTDTHGDFNMVVKLLNTIKRVEPSIIALEMLPQGEFDTRTAHTVTSFFGSYYYELASNLSKQYKVIGLEEKRHRPFTQNTSRNIWRNLVARTRNIEGDWARTLRPYRNENIVAFVGTYHKDPLIKYFSSMPNIKY